MKKQDSRTVPELTVVIPTVGRTTLIPTVDSLVAAQGFERIEVIVAGKVGDPVVAEKLQELCERHPRIRHLPVQFERGDSSQKKNAGWQAAESPLVAFLDDDVTVAPEWPVRMLEAFEQGADMVSGPGLVPPDVGLFARLAGVVLSSPATGYVAWRYRHGMSALVPVKWSKIIGCNMAFRRDVLQSIDGFDPAFWPGEEMIVSYLIQEKGHQLMFYSPAWVYHYPRQSLQRFCRQIFGYGSTRIRLIRAGVEFEPTTLVPAIWVTLVFVGALAALFLPVVRVAWLAFMGLYGVGAMAIAAWMAIESRQLRDVLCCFLIPVVHICYGVAGWWECLHPNKDLSISAQH